MAKQHKVYSAAAAKALKTRARTLAARKARFDKLHGPPKPRLTREEIEQRKKEKEDERISRLPPLVTYSPKTVAALRPLREDRRKPNTNIVTKLTKNGEWQELYTRKNCPPLKQWE
jgi:hypothetical protein